MKRKLAATSLAVVLTICQVPAASAGEMAPDNANRLIRTELARRGNSPTVPAGQVNSPVNQTPENNMPRYKGKSGGQSPDRHQNQSRDGSNEFRRVRGADYVPKTNEDPYTVKPDDTMWNISRKYQVDLDNVIESNPQIPDADLIYPGETLYVPLESDGGAVGQGEIGASMTTNSTGKSKVQAGSKAGVTSKGSETTIEAEVVSLVNRERAKRGLSPLAFMADISNVARIKSEEMRDRNYFGHNSPVYGNPFDMLLSFGIRYKAAGENIAKGQKTAQSVMTAWMNSDGHRKNILNPNYKEIGVGFARSGSGTTYWTQQFITR